MEARGVTPRRWPEAADLAGVLAEPGPFLTLVLATEAEVENASQRNRRRWRDGRDELVGAGADDAVLDLVDPLVDDAHHHGRTLVVVANARGVHHRSHWPRLPSRELARWQGLPSLGVVIERRQEAIPHVLVVADRAGADITAVGHDGGAVDVEAGEQEPVGRKVNAGGWSQRRYQERAENTWEHNAKDVAAHVTRLARLVDARFVAVAGDVRARQLLGEELPRDVLDLVRDVGGSRAADGAPTADPADLERLVAAVVDEDTTALVEKLAEELGQHDRGRGGVAGTVSALQAAQVQVLLVRDDPDDDRTAWFGDEPASVAVAAAELADLGVEPVREGRLADVLVRAALATGAGVRMLPEGHGVPEGVGAILRWA
jgi:hypothetical protein